MKIEFELSGWKELDRMLAQLPKAVQKSTLQKALSDAAIPVIHEARQNAPRSGNAGPHYADSFAIGKKLTRRQKRLARMPGSEKMQATIYAGSKDPKAHLIEFGTGPRRTKSGRYTGQTAPQPVLRTAWDRHKRKVAKRFEENIWKELVKSARRLRRQAKRYEAKTRR